MKNYDIEIEEALKNKVLEFSEIYDFRDTPYEGLISNFYNFCRENIDIHGKNVNINPNVLIFNNHLNSNAFAMLKDCNWLICLVIVTKKFQNTKEILKLTVLFCEHDRTLFKPINKRY